jgi:tRNA A-37 threonylcarbamoyl transferase component Bud32
VDKRYEIYCMADPLFYDAPTTLRRDGLAFGVADRPVPDGWRRDDHDDWLVYRPIGVPLPEQGWKVHASARLENAEEVLATAWDYCVARQVAFKFLRGRHIMLNYNAKYADRGASGKLITIYPIDDAQFEMLLKELGELLDGQPGPYILSDLRWGGGPLYVRYGGFTERNHVFDRGTVEPAIVDGAGRLVPDRREPRFTVPPWLTLPNCLEPHLRARTAPTASEMPYHIERALHFSNGGGIYLARDSRTDESVVLKEARPHAGLTADGRDAVARQECEWTILTELAGLDVVPSPRDRFVLDGHHFLVEDHVDGEPLQRLMVQRYPLVTNEPADDVIAEYTRWAMRMTAAVEDAVDKLHRRGVAMNDLHPYNVLVSPDDRVVLIDFEVATRHEETCRSGLGNPAFAAPANRQGIDRDRYALGCLRLSMFLPLTALFQLDLGKAEELAETIRQYFPVPTAYLDEALQALGRPARRAPRQAVRSGPAFARSLADAITMSATPERADRLFPGDIQQFITRGPGLAYGAAGVLYALTMAGYDIDANHLDWLAERATNPAQGSSLGFYDGLHGAAYVLDLHGRRAEALDVLAMCLRERWTDLGDDLLGGLAGIGLNLEYFSERTGDPQLAEAARLALDTVADRLGAFDSVATVSGGGHPRAGLLRGSSGPALLFLRHYERTGDPALLDLAATALRQDLRRCKVLADGSMHVDEGWRTMPYLMDGSVGIGLVLDDYLRHRRDEELALAAERIRRAANSAFYIQPGLFSGRAGMILYLARATAATTGGGHDSDRSPLARHLDRLRWHAIDYRGNPAFPGEQLLRLSMDLATGTAGVLLAVAAAADPYGAHLPFLAPHPAPVSGPGPDRMSIINRT